MLFNSLQFLLFFPVVCGLYFLLPSLKWRNIFLLSASYYFYMNWQPVYALLLLSSTMITYLSALGIGHYTSVHKRRLCLTFCLILNLSILFLFKYYNFIAENLTELFQHWGIAMQIPDFELLLPVGISFYTFQALGYAIDVYRGKTPVEKNIFTYALFVSFFPQLVAGPIERSGNLLPQFHEKHSFNGDKFIEGMKLMIWGYFMKLCVAENAAPYVNAVYNNIAAHNGTSILFATFLFTFQIFCDFGGYSLIAIGAAKCMGFNLMQNFNHPYLSQSMREFWRRWHISLSSWFADYVYIPLGGSRCSKLRHYRNIFITMLVSGIWHGANWTFICWGAYHGILQIFNALIRDFGKHYDKGKKVIRLLNTVIVFLLTMFGWTFFRANSLSDAEVAFTKMFTSVGLLYNGEGKPTIALCLGLIVLLMFKEIKDELGWNIHLMHHKSPVISAISTGLMIVVILLCAKFEGGEFIYFQF